jgi:hypothetical protein
MYALETPRRRTEPAPSSSGNREGFPKEQWFYPVDPGMVIFFCLSPRMGKLGDRLDIFEASQLDR